MSTPEPQVLTLAVTGNQATLLGARSRKTFAAKDGSIGRAEDCDWPLAAAGVSRLHAMVRYVNGLYFIEDRSTNGMLLNGSPLIKGDPAPLKDGDRLRIDNFDIAVSLQQDNATIMHAAPRAASPPAAEQPAAPPEPATFALPPTAAGNDLLDFGLGGPLAGGSPSRAGTPPDNLIPSAPRGGGDSLIPDAPAAAGGNLDPLSFLDAPLTPEPDPSAPPVPDWNHSPGMDDHFRPPTTNVQRASSTLPDDWDPLAPEQPVAPAPAPPQAQAPAPAAPPGASRPAPPAAQPPIWPSEPPAAAPAPPAAPPPIWPAETPPARPAQPAAPHPPQSAAPAAPAVGGSLQPAPELDAILHIVVDGVMDVLRARAEIKNTFRLPVTVIQRSENNPLKFALGTDEAIKKILAPPDPAFLTGPAAFDDAFDDIRCHQMAMLAGVRAGFDAVLRHFDPEHFDREGEGSRYGFGGKGKHWERYREHYQSLVADPDACFRRLFGDEFARAYEEQLARLKSARKAQRPRQG
ncbi:MAG TPA: type VI secretion system-associated FHA domain protein TagH [Rhodanobacteraceae bacterium]|nr:type VI secretion system-associated FHA domain protein TagH [Rhodanobacteraceae bacterium]